jgi:FixJ family two-component response regulator
MPDRATVFVVDDDLSLRTALSRLLGSVGLVAETFPTAEDFLHGVDPIVPAACCSTCACPASAGSICSAGSMIAATICR